MVASLRTDGDAGLSVEEAANRLGQFGPNKLDDAAPEPFWHKVLRQFTDPLVLLLLFAIVVSVVAWLVEGAEGTPFEAIIILVIVFANAVVGLWQEARAEAAVAALQKMAAPSARVLRGHERVDVASSEVVVGDVLVLAEGDAVAADARLLKVRSLKVAEAPLTGESEPVLKGIAALDADAVLGDRTNMVYAGTAITSGTGLAAVVATGMSTEIGRIASLLGEAEEEDTPLQREINRVSRLLGIVVVVIAVIVSGAILVTSDVSTASEFVDVLLVGVSLAVAAVPEGLPAILAVVLALGVQRMASKNAIVKNLSSVETLGSASVICTDKTGTLTKNEMTITRVVTASGAAWLIAGDGDSPSRLMFGDDELVEGGAHWNEVRLVVGGGSLANDASAVIENGTWSLRGDPTETAFLVAEERLGLADARKARFHRLDEVPFTSERKLMSSIESDGRDAEHAVVVTKGAPDVLLSRCTHERVQGQVTPLDEVRRADIMASVEVMADDALRTLAVAYRLLDDRVGPATEELEFGLIYLGSVGIIDPPRPEVGQAVAEAHEAGIRVIMITGDHPRTAARIAEELGISASPATVVSGVEIEKMTDDEFGQAVEHASVFARVAPEHKLRVVAALKEQGNVVAMTGDGVNDAPALKSADIGVAMGITGTEVSKEAANMILADDNFATILQAVREGRGIFSSIRKFLRYLLSSNMGEVLTMFIGVLGAGVLGLDTAGGILAVPLLATHILWINLLTDAAPALALGVDPPIGNPMHDRPRKITDRIIDLEMQIGIVITGLAMAIATLAALDLTLIGGLLGGSGNIVEARTMAFTTLVIAQLFNAFSSRSARQSAFTNLFTNRLLWGAIGLSLALQILVVHLEVLNTAFETTGLSLLQWLVCTLLGSIVLVTDELKKLVMRRARM